MAGAIAGTLVGNQKLSQKQEIKNHLKVADFGNQVRERREHEALERQNNQEVRKSPKNAFHTRL